jgi:sensor histidine kinase regulating citrate/malate metabolism
MASLGGVITVDLNGVVTFINRVASELTGLKTGKCVGDLIKMYLKYAMENGKQVLKPLMKAIRKMKYCCLITPKRNDDSNSGFKRPFIIKGMK